MINEDAPIFFMSRAELEWKSRKCNADILCHIGSSYHECISTDTNGEEVCFAQDVYPVGKQTLKHMRQLRGSTSAG